MANTQAPFACNICEYKEVECRCSHKILVVDKTDTNKCCSLKMDAFQRHYCEKNLNPTVGTVKMSGTAATRDESRFCLQTTCFENRLNAISAIFEKHRKRYIKIGKELFATPGLRDILAGVKDEHKRVLKGMYFSQERFNKEGKRIPEGCYVIGRVVEFVDVGKAKAASLRNLIKARVDANFSKELMVGHHWLTPGADILLFTQRCDVEQHVALATGLSNRISKWYDRIYLANIAFAIKHLQIISQVGPLYERYAESAARWEAAKMWGDTMIPDGFGDETLEERMQREFNHLNPELLEGFVGRDAFYLQARHPEQQADETYQLETGGYFDNGVFDSLKRKRAVHNAQGLNQAEQQLLAQTTQLR